MEDRNTVKGELTRNKSFTIFVDTLVSTKRALSLRVSLAIALWRRKAFRASYRRQERSQAASRGWKTRRRGLLG